MMERLGGQMLKSVVCSRSIEMFNSEKFSQLIRWPHCKTVKCYNSNLSLDENILHILRMGLLEEKSLMTKFQNKRDNNKKKKWNLHFVMF